MDVQVSTGGVKEKEWEEIQIRSAVDTQKMKMTPKNKDNPKNEDNLEKKTP